MAQASLQAAPKRIINFEGRRLVFPADATDAEISSALAQPPIVQATAQPAPAPAAVSSGFIEVEAPDGTIIEFPDGMDRGAMAAAMRTRYPPPAAASSFIKIRAPDGSIVQFPNGTTDAAIVDVMRQHYPAPHPLAALAEQSSRELLQNSGVMDARNAADLAALTPPAPAPTSWMDTLKGAVMGGPDSRGAMGVVDQGVRGLAQGATSMAALPVDIAAAVSGVRNYVGEKTGFTGSTADKIVSANPVLSAPGRIVGALASLQPYVGSEALHGYMDSANRATADALGVARPVEKGQNLFERGANRVGQEVGAAALPIAGAVGHGAKIGVDAARRLPTLVRMFVEPAAINPAQFASKEMATAAAAGSGAATVNEFTGASTADKKTGGQAAGDITGALLGALGLGVARTVAKPINDIRQAVMPGSRDKFSNDVVKNTVVDRIINTADTLPKVEGQPVDTVPLVDAINRGARVDIPGFKDSIADRTGDSGLAALEYSRQSGQGAGQFTARRTENTAAVDAAMNRNAPEGNPADLRAELDLERNRRLTDAEVQALNAQGDATRAVGAVTPQSTAAQRGNTVRTALEDARGAARDRTEAAYQNADVARRPIDAAELSATIDNATANLTEVERGLLPQATLDRVRRLGDVGEQAPTPTGLLDEFGSPITRPPEAPPPVDMKEATDLLSELGRMERAALADPRAEKGGRNAARVIGQVADAVEGFVGRNLPEADQQALAAARRAKFEEAEAFTRQGDPVAQAVSRYEGGQPRVRDDRVAGLFTNPQAMDRLFAQADTPQTRAAIRDEVLSRGDTSSAQRIRDFTNTFGEQVDRFPGLRQELDAAATAREREAGAGAARDTLTRELGTPDRPGTSTVGKYLQYGDERSQDALKGVIASKNPGAAMDEMLAFVNNDPAAVVGARKSFWDLMQSKTRSNGETTKGLDGAQPWMPNRLKNFLDNPANQAVAERLYRDNPEQLSNVRKIADELQNVDLRSRAKAANTSGTAQSISNVLTPETLQSRFYAYKRGQTSLGFMLTALGSVAARRLVRGAQGEAMEKLLDRALLDPDLAAQLLKENNPANRAALARTAKAYLGNEASTLADILDGKPEDPVKKAIMR